MIGNVTLDTLVLLMAIIYHSGTTLSREMEGNYANK